MPSDPGEKISRHLGLDKRQDLTRLQHHPVKSRKSLQTRHKFLVSSLIFPGIPFVIGAIWLSISIGMHNILAELLVIPLALGGAYLWGLLMWEFFVKGFVERSPKDIGLTPLIMFEYEARFDEESARQAERAFFLLSVRRLRFWITVVPPPFFSILTLVGYLWQGDRLFVRVFGAFFVLSLLGPIFYYFARPAAAAKLARQSPVRHIRVNSEGLSVEADGRETTISWRRFKYVWHSDGYLLLVINPYMSVNLPKQGMPTGAQEFITANINGTRTNR